MERYAQAAPAKVNLALDILGRRPDGYHEMRMVMQTVSLCDAVTLEEAGEGFALFAQGLVLPQRKTLEQRAAEAFFAAIGRPRPSLRVTLEKKTPAYAGPGGGSADVAALLRLLRENYAPAMPREELEAIGGAIIGGVSATGGAGSVEGSLLGVFVILVALGNDVVIACLVFGINSGAYVAEIIRSGIMSIDNGQFEAGRSLGFNYIQTMRYIIIPQAFKNVLPALANEFIVLLKETSVAGYAGVIDLTKGGEIIRGRTFEAFMPLIAVAAIYLVMVVFFTWLVGRLERRLRNSER